MKACTLKHVGSIAYAKQMMRIGAIIDDYWMIIKRKKNLSDFLVKIFQKISSYLPLKIPF